jgi:anthranilate phosphoribosyltransferase
MSFLEDIHSLVREQQNPQPEFLANYRRLLEINGALSWRDMVQSLRLLILGTPTEEERLRFLRDLTPDHANGEMLGAAAAVLRELAPTVPTHAEPLFDCCGTGGDKLGLFNISTLAGLTLAACGVPIAKHGNRAITSSCGSADLLETLGIPVNLSPEQAGKAIDENGFAFLFAPQYHSATRNVQPLRKKLSEEGRPTLFNLLGPLSNPAYPTHQMVGVFHPKHLKKMAEALVLLDCDVAWVVSGSAGEGVWMDEISACGPTRVAEIRDGSIREFDFHFSTVGVDPISINLLKGGDTAKNLGIAQDVLAGRPGPYLDAVALNAGVSLYLAERAEHLLEGFQLAQEALASGKVADYVDSLSLTASVAAL